MGLLAAQGAPGHAITHAQGRGRTDAEKRPLKGEPRRGPSLPMATPRKTPMKAPAPKPEKKRAPEKKAPAPKGAKKPARTPKPKANQAPAPVEVIDEDMHTPLDHELMGLSIREGRFVDRYIAHYNGSLAYIEAGYLARNANVARVGASQLLIRPNVRAYIAWRVKAMIARDEEHQDSLMTRLRMMAFADAREISEYHKGACRHCWGKFHRWQYTAGEWDEKVTEHAERQEIAQEKGKPAPKAPNPKGGTGYTWGREPNPECPECAGHGLGKQIVHDTRYLSPAAVAIFGGVKEGKDGVEAKLYDQSKALDTLVKIAKLYDDSTKVNMTVDETGLNALFGNVMQSAHETAERLRLERGLDSGKTSAT